MTTLLLEQTGFVISRYISLERLIEESRESYYESLYKSCRAGTIQATTSCHGGIISFPLSTVPIVSFSEVVESRQGSAGKTELVRQIIAETEGQFSLSEIRVQLPSVSEQLIRRVLQQMKAMPAKVSRSRSRSTLGEVELTHVFPLFEPFGEYLMCAITRLIVL